MKTYAELAAEEVRWYRKFGRFPERIKKDSSGIEYVIGDWSWNRSQSTEKQEAIEPIMEVSRDRH